MVSSPHFFEKRITFPSLGWSLAQKIPDGARILAELPPESFPFIRDLLFHAWDFYMIRAFLDNQDPVPEGIFGRLSSLESVYDQKSADREGLILQSFYYTSPALAVYRRSFLREELDSGGYRFLNPFRKKEAVVALFSLDEG